MTKYAAPGTDGSVVTFKPRYENFIGGEYVRAGQGPVLREPDAGHRPDVQRGRPQYRRGRREGARRRARRCARLGQDLGRRAREHPQQDRRPRRGQPRDARHRRDLGERQAVPRDPRRRHPAGHRPPPLLRGRHPCAGGLALARSTRTRSPTTSTSRSASSGRSSRGTSRSSWRSGSSPLRSPQATRSSSSPPSRRPPRSSCSSSWSPTCCRRVS